MRLSALAAFALAPLSIRAFVAFTNDKFSGIVAGEPFKVTWKGDNTPVTITLMDGPSANLAKVSTVASSAIESSYTWTPPANLKSGTYALQITQSGYTNYSPQFSIKASTAVAPSPSATTTVSPFPPDSKVPFPTTPSSPSSTPSYPSAYLAAAAIQQPPYPAGPNNSSNSTIPCVASTAVAAAPSGSETAAGVPVATIYQGNGTAVFMGGVGRVGGGVKVTCLVGVVVGGIGLVF